MLRPDANARPVTLLTGRKCRRSKHSENGSYKSKLGSRRNAKRRRRRSKRGRSRSAGKKKPRSRKRLLPLAPSQALAASPNSEGSPSPPSVAHHRKDSKRPAPKPPT